MKSNITVETSSATYPVFTGENILADALASVLNDYPKDTLYLIIDEKVQKAHHRHIDTVISPLFDKLHTFVVPSGEASKTVGFWEKCTGYLLTHQVRRNTPIIVIGGGVTGDLGGFVAATTLRGVPFIHIPTTLLAMVDSSIGGKTGINFETGKNLIGSFNQPEAVIADTAFLQTLPDKEWINGLSEILKYAAIRDSSIFDEAKIFTEQDKSNIDRVKLHSIINKSIRIKAEIVKEDEFESGVRAYLNFGHTFAHALEKACKFSEISHGEAVFLGMLAAKKLSEEIFSVHLGDPFGPFKKLYSFSVEKQNFDMDSLNTVMKSDKKRVGEYITFVLLQNWQQPVLKTVADQTLINRAWKTAFEEL
ncbi:MAG TPA: 3-dehydroquinate synthase [Balneolaceae bacterium]|nr:3-dehydroquinate synthase [Balneolaceae bacterium]